MTGIVVSFCDQKGYGTIQDDIGKKYFCHFSAIQSNSISLDVGQKVSFDVQDSRRGASAVMVKFI